jgi:hypothetical protein
LTLVQQQCPGADDDGCADCSLSATGCTDASYDGHGSDAGAPDADGRHEKEEDEENEDDEDVKEVVDGDDSEPRYNCSALEENGGTEAGDRLELQQQRRMAWWCCTHERKMCGDHAVFKRKFSSDPAPAARISEGTKARPLGNPLPSSASWPTPGLADLSVGQAALACGSLFFVLAAPLLVLLALRRGQGQTAQVAAYREFRRNAEYSQFVPEATQFSLLSAEDGGLD